MTGRRPIRAFEHRRELLVELEERFERTWASVHAIGVKRPESSGEQLPLTPALPVDVKPTRLVRVGRNDWLTPDQANVVAAAMAKRAQHPRVPVRRPRRRRKRGSAPYVQRWECPVCGAGHSRADHARLAA